MVTAIQKHYSNSLGDIEEVTALKMRIVQVYPSLFPGSQQLTDAEAFALAQVGTMQGLDVFNKEIYYLKQEKWDPETRRKEVKSIGVMPGIRGLRKHAHRQIRYEGGRSATFWIEYQQIIDKEEKTLVGAGDFDFVVKATLRDTVSMGNYLNMRQMIFSNHSSWKDLLKLASSEGDAVATVQTAIENTAKAILGNPPIIVSYGIVKNAELKKDDNKKLVLPLQMFSGQSPLYMAEIRAERRALYKRFDLEKRFGAIVDDAELEAEAIDAEIEATEDQTPEAVTEEPRTREQNISQLGFS
jgi:hypothetical protein